MTPALNWDLPVETDEAIPRRVRVMDPPYSMGQHDTHAVVWIPTDWGETATYEIDGTPCPGDPTLPRLRNVRGFWPADVTVPPPPMRGRITVWVPLVPCRYCDGTGDVHRIDGEWLGDCPDCPRPNPDLPDGLWECDGRFYFECRSCERDTEWEGDPEDFELGHYANVCGGSPRCLP